jgi:hypothetical protein
LLISTVSSLDSKIIETRLQDLHEAAETDSEILTDSLELWMMHERILLLSATNDRRPQLLNILGGICLKYYVASQDMTAPNQGICAYRDALRDAPSIVQYMEGLGVALRFRFELTGNQVDIDEAITVLEESLRLTPDGDSHMPYPSTNLGGALIRRFEQLGNLKDLKRSVTVLENAVSFTVKSHPGNAN